MDIHEVLRTALSKKVMEDCENISESQAKELASSLIEEMQSESYTPSVRDILDRKYYTLIDEIHCFVDIFDCDDTFFWLADGSGRYSDFKKAVNLLFEESLNPIYLEIVNKMISNLDFMQEYPEDELSFYRAPLENKEFLDIMIFDAYNKGELFWKNEFEHIPPREKRRRIEHLEKISGTIPKLKEKAQCFLSYLYNNLNNGVPDFYNSATIKTLAEEELKRAGF